MKSIAYKDFAASIRSKTNLENYFFSYRERREIPIVIPDFAGSFAIAQRYQQSTAIDGWEGELLAPNLTSAFVLTGQRKF